MYNSKLIFTIACLGMLLFGVVMLSFGTILPEIVAKYQVDEIATGTLLSILPVGVLVGSLAFGPIADMYGYKWLLITCIFIVILGLEGIAFAKSWRWLEISAFMIGTGGGALNGTTSGLVASIFPEKKGARLSFLGAFFGVGALLIPSLINLLSNYSSPEEILSYIGYSSFLLIIGVLLTRFPKPNKIGGFLNKKGTKFDQRSYYPGIFRSSLF